METLRRYRPFGGRRGLDLAIQSADGSGPVILDRSWLTVATLVDDRDFYVRWTLWIPILCCAGLPTTLARLARRDEPAESLTRHRYYLARYREIAEVNGCAIVDTSHASEEESAAEMALAVLKLLDGTGHR